jgi:RimJ/RimL family protein N-acetyltransferase
MKPGSVIRKWQTKKGNQVVIRVVQASDLTDLLNYANELIKEDTYIQLYGEPLTVIHEKKYLGDCLKKVKNGQKIHLIVEVNGKFAGSCEVRRFEKRKSHVGEIGISISQNYREEGIGTVCLEILIAESKKIGLKLLTLNCFEINHRAIHTYQKVGFTVAGTIPGMLFYKDKFENEVIMYLKI